ncbi:hypothetical protein JCM8097_006436 [Rhodosporidiobolus ruineniae]
MGYLDDRDDELELVFLPARAANVAVVLATLGSFAALVLLVQCALAFPLAGGHVVLVSFLAVAFLAWAISGLVVAYARWLPPPDSRLWEWVSSTTNYLGVLWIITLALGGTLAGEVLFPRFSCNGSSCSTETATLAISSSTVLLVALLLNLLLAVLVTVDLRNHRHTAYVLIRRAELDQERRQARAAMLMRVEEEREMRVWEEGRAAMAMEAGMGPGGATYPTLPGMQQQAKTPVVSPSFLARARQPSASFPSSATFAPPASAKRSYPAPPPPGSLAPPPVSFASFAPSSRPSPAVFEPAAQPKVDALGVPAMFSIEKRHHYDDEDDGAERERRRGRSRRKKEEEEEDEEGESTEEEERRRRRRKRKEADQRAREEDEAEEDEDDDTAEPSTDDSPPRRSRSRSRRAIDDDAEPSRHRRRARTPSTAEDDNETGDETETTAASLEKEDRPRRRSSSRHHHDASHSPSSSYRRHPHHRRHSHSRSRSRSRSKRRSADTGEWDPAARDSKKRTAAANQLNTYLVGSEDAATTAME